MGYSDSAGPFFLLSNTHLTTVRAGLACDNKKMNRQKDIERLYLDEARRASSVFPAGKAVEHERPDFLVPVTSGTLGIEVTELCREDPRAEGGRLSNVAPRAEGLYLKRPGVKPVNVSPVFSLDAAQMKVGVLAKTLADFVYQHRDDDKSFEWNEVPKGYYHIGVFPSTDGRGCWRYFRAGDTVPVSRELIGGRIAEKNARVSDYRAHASEVWLLIVNDLFIGPGEVSVRPEVLAQWTFPRSFDKVLLFERQPGGSGQVIELQR